MQLSVFYRRMLVVVGLILIFVVARQALLSSYVSLTAAPSLSGQVAQATITTNQVASLPVAGKDFTLSGVHYFSNNNWVFLEYNPTSDDANGGYAILQKKSGIFQVVLGPSSTVPEDAAYALPPDMVAYLSQKGIF